MAGKQYPDLRYLFMRGLIDHEKQQRTRHYLKSAAECTSRAVVSLELSDQPIRSVKQARQLEGIGGETCTKLTKLEKERNFSALKPLGGRFVSSAGAIMVALLDSTDEELLRGHSQDRPVLISEDQVKRRAVTLSEESFLENTTLGEGFCKAWWRLEVLIKRGFIRRRSYKKEPVLQLLPLGRDIAQRLRGNTGLISMPPLPVRPPVLPSVTSPTPYREDTDGTATKPWDIQGDLSVRKDDALYTNDDEKDGVVMLVDIQEWGGDRVGLGDLCRLLDQTKIRYKTRRLGTGDYSWFWRVDGVERTLPCLIERKRADDVARTLKEGRFWSQVNKMVAWRKNFLSRGIDCSLHYILEREPENYVVQCPDGCQGVGACGNPTLTQVKVLLLNLSPDIAKRFDKFQANYENAIEDLKKHPDLQVKLTDSIEVTVVLLSSITADLVDRANKGDFDELVVQELAGNSNEKVNAPTAHKIQDLKEPVKVNILNDSDVVLNTCLKDHQGTSSTRLLEYTPDFEVKKNLKKSYDSSSFVVVDSDDDDLAIAIEKSKSDASLDFKTGNQVFDQPSIDRNGNHYGKVLETNIRKSDSDIDEDLALAIEKSKTDTRFNSYNERIDNSDLPLMQYHCSLTKSVTCTTQSPKKKNNTNGYRPKINRTKQYNPYACTKPELTVAGDNINKDERDTCETEVLSGLNSEIGKMYSGSSLQNVSLDVASKLLPSDFHNSESKISLAKDVLDSTYDSLDNRFDSGFYEKTDRFTRVPFLGVNYNTSPNRRKGNRSVNSQNVDLDYTAHTGEQDYHKSGTKDICLNKTVRKKKKTDFHLSPKKDYVERNLIGSLEDINENPCSRSKRRLKTTSSNSSVSCSSKSLEKTSERGTLGYNSDEDIFEDQNNNLHDNIEIMCASKRQTADTGSLHSESDRSSLDSLPDLESVCSRKRKATTNNFDKDNHITNPVSNQTLKCSFRNISANSEQSSKSSLVSEECAQSAHSSDSSEPLLTVSFSDSDDDNKEGDSDALHRSPNLNNKTRTKCKQTRHKSDSYKIVNDNAIEEKIDMIVAVLPQLDREKCFWLLHRFLGRVERCIEHVLQEENKLSHGDVISIDSQ